MQAESLENRLTVKSTAFDDGESIPLRNSARGEDISPSFSISNISPNAKFIAITLDDMSHPIFGIYNHWVIWNIPVQDTIPEAILRGKTISSLGGAQQGIGYGRHRYKGPKPPRGSTHIYQFTVYTVDCMLELPSSSKKTQLLACMDGHILQSAILSGTFQSK
ncbi:MAG TPA: YbhB/YbcL family Raf kinase inhibitor-like protein [Oscillospiraceae bacterium]|nr:YbhB/YbcL family Raf kinase inhibitor-like protein [Oscillospiraceae bacterium]